MEVKTLMIKEHNGSTWQGKAYSKIVDTTQQVTSFPVVVRPMENAIPSWTIIGNMSQSGTPTPVSPITPSECGDKTSNLINNDNIEQGGWQAAAGTEPTKIENYMRCRYSSYFVVHSNTVYYDFKDLNINIAMMDNDGISLGGSGFKTGTGNYTLLNGAKKITLIIGNSDITQSITPSYVQSKNISLDYGYVLPIKTGSTTTPVYLGNVQSTRKIKKLVLTGNEECYQYDYQNTKGAYVYNVLNTNYSRANGVCSHYPVSRIQTGNSLWIGVNNNSLYFVGIMDILGISTVAAFKTYLAQQYSAGTPVTVWYVLAEPTTTTLNEPLRKIGTYSDSVSGTNLSVTAHSPTTIDVDTSLKPSEMDLTYTGLKMCGRKKCASLLADNPLCGIGTYKDTLDLATGAVTRKIKKLVFTGQENWTKASTFLYLSGLSPSASGSSCVSTHYPYSSTGTNKTCMVIGNLIRIYDNTYATADGFKTFLAQQYSAGTPVTVWYVLETATTETVPVPEGLTGTVEGYLNQSGTPTPSTPIYPTANSVSSWQ